MDRIKSTLSNVGAMCMKGASVFVSSTLRTVLWLDAWSERILTSIADTTSHINTAVWKRYTEAKNRRAHTASEALRKEHVQTNKHVVSEPALVFEWEPQHVRDSEEVFSFSTTKEREVCIGGKSKHDTSYISADLRSAVERVEEKRVLQNSSQIIKRDERVKWGEVFTILVGALKYGRGVSLTSYYNSDITAHG